MEIQELVNSLQTATGNEVLQLMQEASALIRNEDDKELIPALQAAFAKAIPKRQGSITYLLTLAGKQTEEFAHHKNQFVREAYAKALLHHPQEKELKTLQKRLQLEESFRIKKFILYALRELDTDESYQIIKDYKPEPELFLEHQKLLDEKKECTPFTFEKNAITIVRVIRGFENHWLTLYRYKGEVLSPGWIQLTNIQVEEVIENRDVLFVGKLATTKPGTGSIAIRYNNVQEKEKSKLNKFAHELSKHHITIHPDANYFLQIITPEIACVVTPPTKEKQPKHLPASMQNVVASSLSLLQPEQSTTVIDPFCGSGTLLIEHQLRYPFAKCSGSDKNDDALHLAKINARAMKCKINFTYGNAVRLPLREESVDRIICNPPFNKRVKAANIDNLYHKFFKEVERVLEIGGVLIMYTTLQELMKECIQSSKKLDCIETIDLDLDAVQPTVYVLQKRIH